MKECRNEEEKKTFFEMLYHYIMYLPLESVKTAENEWKKHFEFKTLKAGFEPPVSA